MRKAKGEADLDADKNKKILSAEDKLYQLPKRLQVRLSLYLNLYYFSVISLSMEIFISLKVCIRN